MDEHGRNLHEKVKGAWKSLYRAVYKEGQTVDLCLATAMPCKAAALRLFDKALQTNGMPKSLFTTGPSLSAWSTCVHSPAVA